MPALRAAARQACSIGSPSGRRNAQAMIIGRRRTRRLDSGLLSDSTSSGVEQGSLTESCPSLGPQRPSPSPPARDHPPFQVETGKHTATAGPSRPTSSPLPQLPGWRQQTARAVTDSDKPGAGAREACPNRLSTSTRQRPPVATLPATAMWRAVAAGATGPEPRPQAGAATVGTTMAGRAQ
jgi:hypothetical protein